MLMIEVDSNRSTYPSDRMAPSFSIRGLNSPSR